METKIEKAVRQRSPNYPAYSLQDCIQFLTRFYNRNKTSEAHFEDAVKAMGHSPSSSTANRVVSAMQSFGLLESRGSLNSRFLKATKLAQEIMLTENADEKMVLFQKAALTEDGMKSVWDKWKGDIPTESSIQKALQLEMGYSDEGAKKFSRVIIDTYQFANLFHLQNIDGSLKNENEEDEIQPLESPNPKKSAVVSTQSRSANLLLQGQNRQIVLSVPFDLSSSEFELLQKWLEIQKIGLINDQIT